MKKKRRKRRRLVFIVIALVVYVSLEKYKTGYQPTNNIYLL
jgi:hypothetical protein